METRDHRLVIGGVAADDLAARFGSPLYVYEEDVLRRQARILRDSFPHKPFQPRYSMKANSNPHILALAAEEGLDLEVVSPGEIALALGVGVPGSRLHFFSTGMTSEEMAFARARGVEVTIDTVSQLARWAAAAPGAPVSVRLNPGAGLGHHDHVVTGGPTTKFGTPVEHAGRLLAEAARCKVSIEGLHMHVGSNFMDPAPFMEMVDVLLKTASNFPDLKTVCVGGGFGIAYKPADRSLDIPPFGKALSERFAAFCRAYGRSVTLAVEPGRFLVCEAGVLLTRVTTLQEGTERRFAITDSGFNHLVRPMMYGAYHPILKASGTDLPASAPVDVCGNICETGDIFQRDCSLPALKEGDLLAITHAGAYGYVMGSLYNTRPLPAEVMVKDGKARLIRRRETPESLAGRELDAAGLGRQAGH